VLALWLAHYGIRIRVVDKASEAGTTSRALVVHARILEWYRMMGIADDLLAASRKMVAANLWVGGRRRARAPFGDIGKGLSPFPYAVIFPQDEHEKLLIAKLAEAGVRVERGIEVAGLAATASGVTATLQAADGTRSQCACAYLAGCDGAHSFVRGAIHAQFPGGTYQHVFYVADVQASGAVDNGELNVALDTADFLAVFPLKAPGHVRLVGTVSDRAVSEHHKLEWDDVRQGILALLRIDVRAVNWFSTYHVHHRVTQDFRDGGVFLLGDAAHIHSPVGGQGMNTGIGDAVNLAWKLAAVLRGRAAEALLDTYTPERRAFALKLVASTDRAFVFVTRDGPLARFVRMRLVPALLPRLFTLQAVLRFMFRTVSQTAVEYRASELSRGHAGGVRAGDRLPWVEHALPSGDNFGPLGARDWQVHVYGEPSAEMTERCAQRGIALHAFPWGSEARAKHLGRDAAYLVRPDGYVAWADARQDAAGLGSYLDRWQVTPLENAKPR
jgi:2-polyprenyl-6-methoxyphenol hydroxylase-like FAD-dependent oxidoreductase